MAAFWERSETSEPPPGAQPFSVWASLVSLRSLLCQVCRIFVFFWAGLCPFSQTARLQGSHFPGAVWTLGGFQPYFLPRPGPLVPPVTSQIPGITTPPKSPLLWPGEPARSREEPPRTKWAREGKEVGAAAPPCKKFRETPRTPPPSPFRLMLCYAVLSHLSRVRLCATP